MKPTGIEWDKLPAVIEAPGYNKATDEWKLTISTPSKYRDPYVIALHARMGQVGVFFFVPCGSLDEVEALLRQSDNGPQGITNGAPPQEVIDRHYVSVEVMAQVLGVDPRTVQLDAEKGLLVRTARGQYDTLASCGTLRKALRAAESGQNDAYAEERTRSIRLKRQEREINLLERIGKLANAEVLQRGFENVLAMINQKLNMMPKSLSPRLESVAAMEAEQVLDEWKRKIQSDMSAQDIGKLAIEAGNEARDVKKEKKQKRSRAKTQRRKERRST
jgi:hypothetical protein